MKTLRYNTETQQYTTHQGQYLTADKQPGRIDPPYVQLEVIETPQPSLTATQKMLPVTYLIEINEGEHDLTGINGTATEVWQTVEKSAVELAREDWHHETPLRIHAPKALLADQQLMAIMLLLRNIQRVETETGFYLYVNEIAAEDEATFAYLQSEEIITVEEWPDEGIT